MENPEAHNAAVTAIKNVFTHDAGMAAMLQAMTMHGVEFEKTFYNIKARHQGKLYNLTLPVSVKKLEMAAGDASVLNASRALLMGFLKDLQSKTVGFATGGTISHPFDGLDKYVDGLEEKVVASLAKTTATVGMDFGTSDQTVIKAVKKALPATPVKLVKADMLGQKVLGTSAGSTYRLVAASQNIKMAAKIDGKSLSVRVECVNPDDETVSRIKKAGFSWKNGPFPYGSVHFDVSMVPLERVLGALLFGMNEKFDHMIQNAEELKSL